MDSLEAIINLALVIALGASTGLVSAFVLRLGGSVTQTLLDVAVAVLVAAVALLLLPPRAEWFLTASGCGVATRQLIRFGLRRFWR